jgi:hypothetical protein
MGRPGQVGLETARLRLKQRGIPIESEWTGLVGSETDSPRELGTVTRKAWTEDDTGLWEHREIVAALTDCPECGKTIECLADTDGWEETFHDSRVFRHTSFGPPMGECSACEVLLAETEPGSDLMSVFDTSRHKSSGRGHNSQEGA